MDHKSLYEISASYPELTKWYGWLAGVAYTLPYSIVGLVIGAFTSRVNRKFMLGLTMMLGGITQYLAGAVNSFPFLCGMRVLHGSLNAATTPLSYSLISDYVPPEKRATANSVLSSAIYLGISLSSLSILLIKSQGWRWAYQFMGLIGVGLGILAMTLVKEPKLDTFAREMTKEQKAEHEEEKK